MKKKQATCPMCVCKEERAARDMCIIQNGEEDEAPFAVIDEGCNNTCASIASVIQSGDENLASDIQSGDEQLDRRSV